MDGRFQSVAALGAVTAVCLASAGGCGGHASNGLGPETGDDDSGSVFGNDDGGGSNGGSSGGGAVFGGGDAGTITGTTCAAGGGLACDVPQGCTTTLSGTVYDPAGTNPIYNAVVFVPNDPAGTLPKITPGTHSCNTCDVSIGDYVAATTTDAKGHFTLTGVPATTKVPFVVQIGKWRREVFLPQVNKCTNNAVPAASSRLPKNHTEGDMPQMAVVTGLADQLGCFLAQIGIDPAEFSAPHAGGRLDVYQGVGGSGLSSGTAGDCTTSSCPLWATKQDLEYYDIAVLACEGGENTQTKTPAEMQNMHDWLDEGGKMFATHFHYVWFKDGPSDFQNAATWLGTSGGDEAGNYDIDTTFPKGQVLHDWLANIGDLSGNQIALTGVANSVSTVKAPTQRWIYDSSTSNVKYLSLLTPVGGMPASGDAGNETGPAYCGKAVFSDLHAGGVGIPLPIPSGGGCTLSTGPLTPQEAALEFLFFDLSACVSSESQPPPPPPLPTK
jgi:hypothetical protein